MLFLSYSTKDHHFAELADLKLRGAGIDLWRDRGQLRAGSDWRNGIERGIADCLAILLVLSTNSVESSYVTFEWAYALGKSKVIIPLKLSDCQVHPKLEPIQYLDFSIPGALPWESLFERIHEIEADADSSDVPMAESATMPETNVTGVAKAILAYLNQRGYQMVSFERLRRRIDANLTDHDFEQIIAANSNVFRQARLKDNKKGIAKLIP